jgi:superfamily II DNA or RNA helicase
MVVSVVMKIGCQEVSMEFEVIKELEGSVDESNGNILLVSGPHYAKERLMKNLHIFDKSANYNYLAAQKSIIRLQKFRGYAQIALEKYPSEANKAKYDDLTQKIEDLRIKITEFKEKRNRYFYEVDGDKLFIPAGYWYMLGNHKDNFHKNTAIGTYFVPGLRDYQKEAVRSLLKYKRNICVLATGLGKTLCIASIALSGVKAGLRSIVIVPSDFLVGQIEGVLIRYHQSVTGASSSRTHAMGSDIMVCTAFSASKYVNDYDIVLIDEGHHMPCDTWFNLMGNLDRAQYIYGFTATPFREDGLDLAIHAFAGPISYQKDAKWGIQNGFIEHFDVYRLRITVRDKQGKIKTVGKDSLAATAYKSLVNEYVIGIIKDQVLAAVGKGRMCMVLFKNLAQAEILAKMLKK